MTPRIENNPDGSYDIVLGKEDSLIGRWHRPKTRVPQTQWHPDTGITRYEWARRQTPEHQVEFFQRLQQTYRETPPTLITEEDYKQCALATMPNGSTGLSKGFQAIMDSKMISMTSPDETWRFSLICESKPEFGVSDYLIVSHANYHTLADWALLVRFRSWVIEDHRPSMIYMPGFNSQAPFRYNNVRPNAMQIVCPRVDS